MLTASPVANDDSPSSTTTSPASMPMRTSSSSSLTASWTASAVRIARSPAGPQGLHAGRGGNSSSEAEGRAGDRRQRLLLVVDGARLVGRDVRGVVRRDEEAVHVVRRDGQAEVVPDEAAAVRAGVARSGARILREPADVLARLLRIPRELGDAEIGPNRHGTRALVRVRLQRRVDAEV